MFRGIESKPIDQNDTNEDALSWLGHLSATLPLEFIDAALQDCGVARLRGRKISAPALVWLIVGLALCRRLSVRDVLRKLELPDPPTDSAICQRRESLGEMPLRHLFLAAARAWCAERQPAAAGLPVRIVDGTTMRLADSPDIVAAFGRPAGNPANAPAAWPQARIVTLLAADSRIVRAAEIGAFGESESALFERLLLTPGLEPSLLVLDRGFASWVTVARCQQAGHQVLVRGKTTLGAGAKVVQTNAPGDEWIEVQLSQKGKARLPGVTETWRVRRVLWSEPGHRDKTLLTTVPPEELSAQDLIEQYRGRWEIEVAFDEMKTHMLEDMPTLRSRSVARVRQEIWAHLLAYNLVRVVMARAAGQAGLPPQRMRFRLSLVMVRDFLQAAWYATPGSIPRLYAGLLRDIAADPLPPRRKRTVPREAKCHTRRYPVKVVKPASTAPSPTQT